MRCQCSCTKAAPGWIPTNRIDDYNRGREDARRKDEPVSHSDPIYMAGYTAEHG